MIKLQAPKKREFAICSSKGEARSDPRAAHQRWGGSEGAHSEADPLTSTPLTLRLLTL